MTTEIGALAGALAKAQGQFGTVKRDKEVVVQKKSGGEYRFKYAPLDSVLEAVRKPLADQGLVVVQILDDGDLVTSLVHESGAIMSGRVSLPPTTDVQAYGSAITYLRRYAIQALLGIAAEDDDDGNRAAGNDHTFAAPKAKAAPVEPDDGSLIGIAETGKVGSGADFELRQSPEGPVAAFRLKQGRSGFKVIAHGALAIALAGMRPEGQQVKVWGSMQPETWTPAGSTKEVTYNVVHLERMEGPDFVIPAVEAESLPLFDDDEAAAILAAELAESAA